MLTLGDVINHYMKELPDNDFRRKVRWCPRTKLEKKPRTSGALIEAITDRRC